MADRFLLLRFPQDVLQRVLRSMELLELIMFSFSNRAKSFVDFIHSRLQLAMTGRFPLLRLPQDALKSVLRSMEPLQLILFSFSSNRAKSIVASVNLKSEVNAAVSDYFVIYANVGEQQFQWQFYTHEVKNGAIPIMMGTPGIVYLDHFMNGEGKRYMIPKVMDIPSWISHIKTIFNRPEILNLRFYEDVGNFDLDSIRNSVIQGGSNNDCFLMIFTRNSDEFYRRIMKTFRNINNLSLETEVYEEGKPPGEVLIQNFSEFHIGFDSENPTTMKLDDILMMNSTVMAIALSELTEKDANRFLKLWMRGNSKLVCFALKFSNEIDVDRNTVLRGIKFKEVPLEIKRFFIDLEDPIEGGIDIIRKDGTRGTIKFKDGYMDFYIWHDYCIVNN